MNDQATTRRIRMGMAGGGPGAFIGAIHRMGAELDGQIELVAGAFSSDAAKSREAGMNYRISPDRAYSDYRQMMEKERARPDAMDFVCIATPNNLHLPIAKAAMELGFHVVSDKPAAMNFNEALALEEIVQRTKCLYALTYTYTGYPMVREAREIVRSGVLGEVRKVIVEYSQGWLSQPVERAGRRRGLWRVDPKQSGVGGAIGDIGVHAFNLLEYVCERRVSEFCAFLSSVVKDRKLDDDCNVLLKLDNGAPGILSASQICTGELNDLRLHVYGEKGGLHWSHSRPDQLELRWPDQPTQVLNAASSYLAEPARRLSRMPPGHPEGVIEAFANIYRDFATAVRARFTDPNASLSPSVPGIADGVRSLAFVETAVESSRKRAGWVPLETDRSKRA